MSFTNGQLWDAYLALTRMGEADLPAEPVGFRLALNRNHLTPTYEAMNEARLAIAERYGVRDTKKKDEMSEEDFALGMEQFQRDWDDFRKQQGPEFTPVAKVETRKFKKVKSVKPNDLAHLLAVGILVVEPSENGGDPDDE